MSRGLFLSTHHVIWLQGPLNTGGWHGQAEPPKAACIKSFIRAAPTRKRFGFTAENRACGGRHALTGAARFIPVPS